MQPVRVWRHWGQEQRFSTNRHTTGSEWPYFAPGSMAMESWNIAGGMSHGYETRSLLLLCRVYCSLVCAVQHPAVYSESS